MGKWYFMRSTCKSVIWSLLSVARRQSGIFFWLPEQEETSFWSHSKCQYQFWDLQKKSPKTKFLRSAKLYRIELKLRLRAHVVMNFFLWCQVNRCRGADATPGPLKIWEYLSVNWHRMELRFIMWTRINFVRWASVTWNISVHYGLRENTLNALIFPNQQNIIKKSNLRPFDYYNFISKSFRFSWNGLNKR